VKLTLLHTGTVSPAPIPQALTKEFI